jgi:hypothetical protein
MAANVKRQFAPKHPDPKEKIDPVKANRCLDNLARPTPPSPLSHYGHCIVKTFDEVKWSRSSSGARSGKTIPQLDEQEKQLCPPLKVFTDIANDPGVVAGGLGITLGDYLGDDVQFEMAEVAFRYEHRKPLVNPEQLPHLPMMMRKFHDQYLKTCKDGTDSILVGIKDEHYFNEVEALYIEFEEFFQLYNQGALDKTIVSCYCR